MNNLTKSTGNFIDPNSPVYDLPYSPKGGSGVLKAQIWISLDGNDIPVERHLGYVFSETVNGIEIEVEVPPIPYASALQEDICNALRLEGIKFDTINLITI